MNVIKNTKWHLEHIIDMFTEGLIIDQVNLEYIRKRSKEDKTNNSFEFQSQEVDILKSINARTYQIEIAKDMLKKYE